MGSSKTVCQTSGTCKPLLAYCGGCPCVGLPHGLRSIALLRGSALLREDVAHESTMVKPLDPSCFKEAGPCAVSSCQAVVAVRRSCDSRAACAPAACTAGFPELPTLSAVEHKYPASPASEKLAASTHFQNSSLQNASQHCGYPSAARGRQFLSRSRCTSFSLQVRSDAC